MGLPRWGLKIEKKVICKKMQFYCFPLTGLNSQGCLQAEKTPCSRIFGSVVQTFKFIKSLMWYQLTTFTSLLHYKIKADKTCVKTSDINPFSILI